MRVLMIPLAAATTLGATLAATLAVTSVFAQTATMPQPAPVQSAPLASPSAPDTSSAQPQPAPNPVPNPVPSPPVMAQPGIDPNSVLAGRKGDASQVEDVTLQAKTALVIGGQASWDDAFDKLTATHRQLVETAAKSGVAVAGRPVTYFAETDDVNFKFEAMLPVDKAPTDRSQLGQARVGQTPAARALRFVHNGPYEDIDGTYEGITAYLDAKGITVRDQFLEEYVNDAKDRADPGFEINIYVLPR